MDCETDPVSHSRAQGVLFPAVNRPVREFDRSPLPLTPMQRRTQERVTIDVYLSCIPSRQAKEQLHLSHTEAKNWSIKLFLLSFGVTAPSGSMAFSFTRFLDHTQRRTTVGRTPLDKGSARRRDLYLTTHNTHSTQTNIHAPGGIRTRNLSRRAASDKLFMREKKRNFLPKIIDLPYALPACPSGKCHDAKYNFMWLAFKDRFRVCSKRPQPPFHCVQHHDHAVRGNSLLIFRIAWKT